MASPWPLTFPQVSDLGPFGPSCFLNGLKFGYDYQIILTLNLMKMVFYRQTLLNNNKTLKHVVKYVKKVYMICTD